MGKNYFSYILFHGYEILVFSDKEEKVDNVVKLFTEKFINRDFRPIKKLIGILVEGTEKMEKMLNQLMIEIILQYFKMSVYKPVATPLPRDWIY